MATINNLNKRKSPAAVVALTALTLLLLLGASCANAEQPQQQRSLPSSEDVELFKRISSMRVGELRRFLADRAAGCDGCVERNHLVERALEVRSWMSADDIVASELSAVQYSAATHMQPSHIATLTREETQQSLAALDMSMHRQCGDALPNGTVYCVQHDAPTAAAM